MAEEKIEARDLNWRLLFPWTVLFRGFQVALDPKKLLLAAAGILTMALGWWLLAVLFINLPWNKDEPRLDKYPPSEYQPKEAADAKQAEEIGRQRAWQAYKSDLRKWNLLHRAAGATERNITAGDVAD